MSISFTKLFSSITESSVWMEENHIRLAWITMLAMADKRGRIWASIPGFANRARISIDEAQEAIKKFMEPDAYSRTKDYDGRRIEEIDGGWRLLNYDKYRNLRDDEDRKNYMKDYMREYRKQTESCKQTVNNVNKSKSRLAQAEAEAEAEADNKNTPLPPKGERKQNPKADSSATRQVDFSVVVEELKNVYAWVNVDAEVAKATLWAKDHRRQVTKRFLVNWLNKIPAPISGHPDVTAPQKQSPQAIIYELNKLREELRKLDEKCGLSFDPPAAWVDGRKECKRKIAELEAQLKGGQ